MPLKETGKLYKIMVKGTPQELVLYPIAKLVNELKKVGYARDAQTIRKWEDAGVTPAATYRSGQKRLYHRKQIDAFVKIAQECDIRQGLSLAMTDFQEKIWEELGKVNKELGLTE